MKISYMKKREDFDNINQRTLDKSFAGGKGDTRLYIYPHLNAIVTRNPSESVKRYLYTEYSGASSPIKRFLTKMYTKVVINSCGILAGGQCRASDDLSDDILIYPCNKKIRIFDFASGTVRVVPKDSFPTDSIKCEIDFRAKVNAPFILPLLSYEECEYSEKIINGRPLARISDGYEGYVSRAYEIWQGFERGIRPITFSEYANSLREYFHSAHISEEKLFKLDELSELEKILFDRIKCAEGGLEVGLSHGDLQAGNIWVENGTDKIYIIDWESVGERSVNYDHAALFRGLRTSGGLAEIASGESVTDAVILYEDLLFRIAELNSLPGDIGIKGFAEYIKTILRNIKNV